MSVPRLHFFLGLCLATVLATAAQAHADNTVLLVTGNAPAHARELAASALSSAADLGGTKIVPSPFLTQEEASLIKCLADAKPWVCMNPLLHAKSVQQLAILSLTTQLSADGAPVIVLTEQIVASSQFAPAGDKRYCEHCTDDVLARLAAELTRSLTREVAAHAGHTVVAIHSVPRGAEIVLDGKLVGATDRSLPTYPGAHSLQLTLTGYQPIDRSVDVADHKTTTVQIDLVPLPGTVVATGGGSSSAPATEPTGLAALPHWVPPVGLSVGVAAFGTGLALQLTKSSPPIGQPQPSRLYSTPGIALVAAGGVITGASVLLWFHLAHGDDSLAAAPASPTPTAPTSPAPVSAPATPPHAARTPSFSAPIVSVIPGGGVVGWTGSF